MEELLAGAGEVLGIGEDELGATQMVLRVLVIYATAVLLVKVGEKRFMGKNTAFDMVLGIILGSVLSRAITGNAPFLPTVAAGLALVALHWLFSVASFHSDWFGALVKGRAHVLVRDGEIDWESMRRSHISLRDLEMALYSTGKVTDAAQVQVARFERNGDISVIPRQQEKGLRVLEVRVEQGVQTVRLELAER